MAEQFVPVMHQPRGPGDRVAQCKMGHACAFCLRKQRLDPVVGLWAVNQNMRFNHLGLAVSRVPKVAHMSQVRCKPDTLFQTQ